MAGLVRSREQPKVEGYRIAAVNRAIQNSRLPFDLDQATVDAARRWKFRPFIVSGHPVKAVGEILFHFQDVNADAWQEVLRHSPPSGE